MKRKWIPALALVVLLTSVVSCYHRSGYHFYPNTPFFGATDPARVDLLRKDPRRDHIRLGEVWIRPTARMDRFHVEGVLREQAARMGADALVIVADKYFQEGVVFDYWYGPRPVYERQIVGIAIRYKR